MYAGLSVAEVAEDEEAGWEADRSIGGFMGTWVRALADFVLLLVRRARTKLESGHIN
jgi:hypothetical protein